MIIVKVGGYEYKYEGNIVISFQKPLVLIKADSLTVISELPASSYLVTDGFWIEDIESIRGE